MVASCRAGRSDAVDDLLVHHDQVFTLSGDSSRIRARRELLEVTMTSTTTTKQTNSTPGQRDR